MRSSSSFHLEPLVVQRKALDHVLFQPLGRPAAELRGNQGFDAVADRNNDVKVIKRHLAIDLAGSFRSNLSEFPTGCHLVQFTLRIDVLDVLDDVASGRLEQLRHLLLRQPDSLVRDAHVDFGKPVFGLIYDNFAMLVHG